MKRKLHTLFLSTAASLALAASAVADPMIVPIVITTGNPGNQGTDNVLFNDGNLLHSGLFVQGNFSGSGSGFIVRFTSSSGNGMIMGSGGQATINGLAGNNPFTSLTFGLEGGATFTNAILNPDPNMDGTIMFSVSYLMSGVPFTQTFALDGNGQNFFGIEAQMGALITSVTFSTPDSSFADASQFRLGGFARPDGTVPDGGTTLMLLGASLTALELLRRTLLKRSPAA